MLHIGLLYTERKADAKRDKLDPHGAIQISKTVKDIKESLINKGYRVTLIEATPNLLNDNLNYPLIGREFTVGTRPTS